MTLSLVPEKGVRVRRLSFSSQAIGDSLNVLNVGGHVHHIPRAVGLHRTLCPPFLNSSRLGKEDLAQENAKPRMNSTRVETSSGQDIHGITGAIAGKTLFEFSRAPSLSSISVLSLPWTGWKSDVRIPTSGRRQEREAFGKLPRSIFALDYERSHGQVNSSWSRQCLHGTTEPSQT